MEGALQSSSFDIINKPRTNYSNNVLRRAVPNANILKKIESISMSKLRVLTYLKFQGDGEKHRRVRTVDTIPKILTIVPGLKRNNMGSIAAMPDPDQVIPESDDEESKQDDALEGLSSDSSVDGENEDDENKMMQ